MLRADVLYVGIETAFRGHRMKGGGVMLTIAGPVILDLNTQRDLMSPEGVYPLFQPEKLAEPLKRLFTFAQRNHIPVISTRLHHLVAPGQGGNNRLLCHPTSAGYQKMPSADVAAADRSRR